MKVVVVLGFDVPGADTGSLADTATEVGKAEADIEKETEREIEKEADTATGADVGTVAVVAVELVLDGERVDR